MQIQKVNSSQNFGAFIKTSKGFFNPAHVSQVDDFTSPGKISLLLVGQKSMIIYSKFSLEEIVKKIAAAIEEKNPNVIFDLED